MEQFLAVAAAHFVALLIPGVDFFRIARLSMAGGWRTASGACVGIAAANGVVIAAAFGGLSLITHPGMLQLVQLAGGLHHLPRRRLPAFPRDRRPGQAGGEAGAWGRNLGLGLVSGLLNPKNALFYLSLAAALIGTGPAALLRYGVWMVSVVLFWDLFVAVALDSRGPGRGWPVPCRP